MINEQINSFNINNIGLPTAHDMKIGPTWETLSLQMHFCNDLRYLG